MLIVVSTAESDRLEHKGQRYNDTSSVYIIISFRETQACVRARARANFPEAGRAAPSRCALLKINSNERNIN